MNEKSFTWNIQGIMITVIARMWHPSIIRFARSLEIKLYPPIHFRLALNLLFIGMDIFIYKKDILKLESNSSKP